MQLKTSKQPQDPQLKIVEQLLLKKLEQTQLKPTGQLVKGMIRKRAAGCAIHLNLLTSLESAVAAIR